MDKMKLLPLFRYFSHSVRNIGVKKKNKQNEFVQNLKCAFAFISIANLNNAAQVLI